VLARIPDLAANAAPPTVPLANDDLFTRQDLGAGGGIVPLVDSLDADEPLLAAPLERPAPTVDRRPSANRPARMTDQAAAPTRRLADQQRRVDRVVASMSAFERPERPAPAPAPTMATAAYRIYAAAAPHAALAVMLALVLSAGLLYFIAFGRPSAGQQPILFDAPTKSSIEATGSAVAPALPKAQPPVQIVPKEVRVAVRPDTAATPPRTEPKPAAKKPITTAAIAPVIPAPTSTSVSTSTVGGDYPRTDHPNLELPAYVAEQPTAEDLH
jgi:hypothetical protein